MLSRWEADRQFATRALALKAAAGHPTPQHSAAEAGLAADETRDGAETRAARRRRERVQHEAEPYPPEEPDVDCVDVAELGKLRTEAVDVPEGYPPMRPVDAEQFRRVTRHGRSRGGQPRLRAAGQAGARPLGDSHARHDHPAAAERRPVAALRAGGLLMLTAAIRR